MSELRNFIRKDLEGGYIICEDVHLSHGTVCTIYISTSSIYALSRGANAPGKRYHELQDILGAVRIRLYVLDNGDGTEGLYNDLVDSLTEVLDDQDLSEDIQNWLTGGRPLYGEAARERLVGRLKSADVQGRGYFVDEDGSLHIMRHGKLCKGSPLSSERLFYLTLFGGPLGLHRFALGKIFSGLIYLLTCGFFLVGWLVDLIQILAGAQRDRKKRYLFALSNRKRKLLVLPFGLLTGALLFLGYLSVSETLSYGLQNLVSNQVNANPQTVLDLARWLSSWFPQ